MSALDILGDPVRRQILEFLATGERAAGAIVNEIQQRFGISQAAVSQHLRVLRENGFASVRIDGSRRVYSLDPAGLEEADKWLEQFRGLWESRLMALTGEIARGKVARKAKARQRDSDPA
jgi:DNA-binding transcriptional ArsR family regulator